MIYKGKHPGKLYHGDTHPASLYSGNRLIAGFRLAKKAAEGRVELGTQPYKAALPSVVVQGVGKQEKLTGKNLFDIHSSMQYEQSNKIRIENNAVMIGYDEWAGRVAEFSQRIPVEPGGYVFTIDTDAKYNRKILRLYDSSGNTIPHEEVDESVLRPWIYNQYYDGWFVHTTQSSTFITIPKNVRYVSVIVAGQQDTPDGHVVTKNWQIEKGSTPTPYEPYCGGIPAPNPEYPIEPEFLEGASLTDGTNTANIPILRALPDGSVRDEIDLRSGTINRRVGEIILTPDLNWEFYYEQGFKTNQFYFPQENHYHDRTSVTTFSNISAGGKIDNRRNIENICYTCSAGLAINISLKTIPYVDHHTSLVEWNKYLRTKIDSGDPAKIWYALATPIIERYDPQILRQHPGYTQLTQQGGLPAPITAEFYEEVSE